MCCHGWKHMALNCRGHRLEFQMKTLHRDRRSAHSLVQKHMEQTKNNFKSTWMFLDLAAPPSNKACPAPALKNAHPFLSSLYLAAVFVGRMLLPRETARMCSWLFFHLHLVLLILFMLLQNLWLLRDPPSMSPDLLKSFDNDTNSCGLWWKA